MLILTRKKNETVIITINGVQTAVTVTKINGDKVRLGIEAPATVKVMRSELVELEKGGAA